MTLSEASPTGAAALERDELARHWATQLDIGRFKDYGPNGLQVEGRPRVQRLLSGTTASLALIEEAVRWQADAIVVHHGLFWRGQDGRVVGWMRARLAPLLAHGLNLFAYHLPLDAHPELGNNAQLGARLGLAGEGRFGDQAIGWIGVPADGGALSLDRFAARVATTLAREPLVLPGDGRPLRRIAWCTGGAQVLFEAAIAAGADAYLSGEVSEPQMHLARETGVAYVASGHHATERFGVQALAEDAAARFGLLHRHVDLPNPA